MSGEGPRSRGSAGTATTARNVGWVFTSNVVIRGTNFVIYALVARQLGVEDFGRLALATAIFQLLTRFTVMGIETVATRRIARSPGSSRQVVEAGAVVILGASITATLALIGFVAVAGYADATDRVILIMFAGAFPYSLAKLFQAVFLGWEQAGLISASVIPVSLIQTGASSWILFAGGPIWAVAISISGAHLLLALLQFGLWRSRIPRRDVLIGRTDLMTLVRASAPFLGVHLLNAAATAATPIILSQVASEAEVGILSAGLQLLVPINLVAEATSRAIFPVMAQRYEAGRQRLLSFGRRSIEAILAVSIPAAVGLAVLARPLIEIVFGSGEGFGTSATVLRIIAFVIITRAFSAVLGQMLWAGNRELISLLIATMRVVTIVVLSTVLASQFGVLGAATALVTTSILNSVLHVVSVRGVLSRVAFGPSAWRFVTASVAMALVLVILPIDLVIADVAAGVVSYVAALLLLFRVPPRVVLRAVRDGLRREQPGRYDDDR